MKIILGNPLGESFVVSLKSEGKERKSCAINELVLLQKIYLILNIIVAGKTKTTARISSAFSNILPFHYQFSRNLS